MRTKTKKRSTRRVALRSTERPKPEPRKKPVPIIVEVAADGFVTIFGLPHVRPIIFNRLVASHPKEADLVDMFHELELPKSYRRLYFPKHVLKTHNVERRTVAGETRRRERLAMHDLYREAAGDEWKKGYKSK